MARDPLADPAPLIRRVYSYVAYRLGDGPDADDATADVFERALRYRASYDDARGEPLAWLLGIARRCVDDALAARAVAPTEEPPDEASSEDLDSGVVRRVSLSAAIGELDERAQDLLALRYGADLTARQIADALGMKTNAVEVALHRTLARLREALAEPPQAPLDGASAAAADAV